VLKVLVVVALLALAIYLLVRVVQRRGILDHRPAPRPFAPDDDPDFLRDLDRKRRHPDDPEA
jgi:hypothetical protein